jgi:hypothetical protein
MTLPAALGTSTRMCLFEYLFIHLFIRAPRSSWMVPDRLMKWDMGREPDQHVTMIAVEWEKVAAHTAVQAFNSALAIWLVALLIAYKASLLLPTACMYQS